MVVYRLLGASPRIADEEITATILLVPASTSHPVFRLGLRSEVSQTHYIVILGPVLSPYQRPTPNHLRSKQKLSQIRH